MCMEAAGRSREDSLPLLLPPSIEPIALCGLCCATANDNLLNLFQFFIPMLFCFWEVEDFLPWNSLIPNWLVSKYTSVLPWLEAPNSDQKFWPNYFRNTIAYPFVDHMMNPEFWGRTKPSVWTPSSCKHQGQEPTWRDPTQYPGKSRPGEIRSNIQTHGQAEKESLEE